MNHFSFKMTNISLFNLKSGIFTYRLKIKYSYQLVTSWECVVLDIKKYTKWRFQCNGTKQIVTPFGFLHIICVYYSTVADTFLYNPQAL